MLVAGTEVQPPPGFIGGGGRVLRARRGAPQPVDHAGVSVFGRVCPGRV